MITACLIGVSGFGNVHYHDLLRAVERGSLKLLGATIINQEEEVAKCQHLRSSGCEIFADYTVMLERFKGQCDLCFIPTGIPFHAVMTIAALRAGANVFVEKPAAATIQDVLAMHAHSQAEQRFVAVGFQTMYAHETLWMKQAILDQQIGPVQTVKCRALWPRLDDYYARNNWAGKVQLPNHTWILDSPFSNALSHQLNMICFLAGTDLTHSARLQSVQAELYRAHEIESADTACIRAVTETGVPLYFLVSHCSKVFDGPEIVIRGTQGFIRWTPEQVSITRADGTSEEMSCETGQTLRDSMIERLLQKIHDPRTFVCDLEIAGAHVLCVNGAHESSTIQQIDASLIQRFPDGDSIQTVISGIDDLINTAFVQEKLFSELDVTWTRPGKVISMHDYRRFPTATDR